MNRMLIVFLIAVSAAPLCRADDLTDAITSVDPRNRLQTGTGAALHNLLGPDENAEEAPAETNGDSESATTLPSYGLSAEDLHDPMGTAHEADEEASSSDDSAQNNELGGYANQDPGVNYQSSPSE